MIFHGLEICCPLCKKEIRQLNEEQWQCTACSRSYPVIFGIPDLRVFPDPYIGFEEDRAKALHLANHFDELSFEELVRFYYLTTPVVPQHHARQYIRGILAAESRAGSMFQEWERSAGFFTDSEGPFLEIGCGTAPLLVAAGKRFKAWLGVDIALRWLIVAKKRLQLHGLDAALVCACAEALPFSEMVFKIAAFDSTLEVVHDQRAALQETFRILKPGGKFVITTPNRHSLGPDPHINLWAGGYLPERWIAAYARRQKAIPPKRNLLSARSLLRLIRNSGFESIQVTVPAIAKAQAEQLPGIFRGLVKVYNVSRSAPVSGSIFRSIGPLLQATAQKPVNKSR
jgi:ubiquinone/menaquinone biosynthesis C-methylase UbiE/uncharacterized protein YbaR (Trm112 family)